MKANEIMTDIIGKAFLENHSNTVDTCKCGDPEKEVGKIALCFIATPEVLIQAKAWGADLLITHEPTFYNHGDENEDTLLCAKKRKLAEESGLTIYRYHDSMHFFAEDLIDRGFVASLGLKGQFEKEGFFVLETETTPLALAKAIQDRLQIRHPRLIGSRMGNVKKLQFALGARGSEPYTAFRENDCQVLLAGELSEWFDGEPIRDLAQMGAQKTVLLLGHVGSERDGMKELTKAIDRKYDGAQAKYFESGELYTYLD